MHTCVINNNYYCCLRMCTDVYLYKQKGRDGLARATYAPLHTADLR